MTVGISADLGSLDPWASLSETNIEAALFAYDTIISLSPNGRIVSGLADRWSSSGRSLKFHIKAGITCSDGAPMNAQVVADNLNYVTNAKNKVAYGGFSVPLGGKATANKKTNTVTFRLAKPVPFVLDSLAFFPVVCQKGLKNRGSLTSHTDGSGPLVLTSLKRNDHFTYTARKGYRWGPGGVRMGGSRQPTTVTYRVVPNESTLANLLLRKDVNIGSVAGPDRKRLQAARLFHQDVLSPDGEFFFNQKPGSIIADVNVRRALMMALNLDQLGSVYSGGFGVKPKELLTARPVPCAKATVAANVPKYSVAAAKALLSSDGWQAGPDGILQKNGQKLALTLIYDTGSPSKAAAAELAVNQWKAIGASVTAVATDVIGKGLFGTATWDMAWQGLGPSNPAQLVGFFTGPAPPAGNNMGSTSNPVYTALTAQAAKLPDQKACALWNRAEVSLLRQVDITPFTNIPTPEWGNGVTFQYLHGLIRATSIRLVR